ncbi:hypothetical protein PBRA_002603 [Plasmodiophora brassicae]|uniref:Magnesium transporter n=1 Tax=Plasmodiophora brassicae TaxID=37360 RepID=A0A0G4J5V7_PLABS|nr:hypothetical protein PBRA_002603 [Plasmodiophora brassicae]
MLDAQAIAGVALCILGGIVDNTGVTIQKISHRRNQPGPYWLKPLWLAGVSMYLLGNICNALGLSLAPQSDVAAVGSLTLVWNASNSYCLLNEPLNRTIVLGIAIVVFGSLGGLAFGSPAPAVSLFELSTEGIIYLCTVAVLLLTFVLVVRAVQRQELDSTPDEYLRMRSVTDPLLSVSSSGPFVDMPPEDDAKVRLPRSASAAFDREVFLSVALPACTGILGSFTVLFAKATSLLVRESFTPGEPNYFTSPPLYITTLAMICIGSCQVHWLNIALRAYDQVVVVPVFAITLEAFNVLGGLIVYHDGASLSTAQLLLFILGVVVSFVGVAIIVFGLYDQRRKQLIRSI